VLDATCPLVSKVHMQGQRYVDQGRTVILIGHAGHPEVEGTMGQLTAPVRLIQSIQTCRSSTYQPMLPVAYITQTTLSVDDTKAVIGVLHQRFSNLVGPETRDICYATQNRQTAVSRARQVGGGDHRGGSPQSSKLEPAARNRPGVRRSKLPGGPTAARCVRVLEGKRAVGLTRALRRRTCWLDDVVAALKRFGPIQIHLARHRGAIQFRCRFTARAAVE